MIYPGLNIQNYIIKDEIGRGGFGSVYLAGMEGSDKLVAIKFLHPKTIRSDEAKQSFMDEMINQARLALCPNIVQIMRSIRYADRHGEHLGMVMEYIDGEPLDLFIQRYSLLPEFVAVPIFIQALNGLGFAHRNNMLHRDIKPGNIIIRRDGLVKIMDFGLSKLTSGNAASESARAASLNYVAPERLDRAAIDARTDIYSMGTTLYEAVTGIPPYQIEPGDWEDARIKHFGGRYRPIREFYDHHSDDLAAIVKRSLAVDPAQRYSSCEEMKNDLVTLLSKSAPPSQLKSEFQVVIEMTQSILEAGGGDGGGGNWAQVRQQAEAERQRRELESENRLKREAEQQRQQQEETRQQVRRDVQSRCEVMVKSGELNEAMELLQSTFSADPGFEYAKDWLGKLKKWCALKEDAGDHLRESKYHLGVDMLEKLAKELPDGEGRQQMVGHAENARKNWVKELENLQGQYRQTKELPDRIRILDQLIKIAPAGTVEKVSVERQNLVQLRSKRRKRSLLLGLGGTVAVVGGLAFLFLILPGMRYNSALQEAEAKIEKLPQAALEELQGLQRQDDTEKVRRLIEKAEFETRAQQSREILGEMDKLMASGNFELAEANLGRVKQEVYKGMSLPDAVMEKEREFRSRAADHFMKQAASSSDPSQQYIDLLMAQRFSASSSEVSRAISDLLVRSGDAVLNGIMSRAETTSDCPRAKELLEMAMRIKAADPRLLALRERIYRRCR